MCKGGEHGYWHLSINLQICYWHHDESSEHHSSTLECHLQSEHAAKLQQLSFAHFELSKFDIRSIKCPLTPGLGMNFAHDV